MSNEDWRIQVSHKFSSGGKQDGGLINIRGNTPEEVQELLTGVQELVVLIVGLEQAIGGVTAVAPLSIGVSTPTPPVQDFSGQGFPTTPPVATVATVVPGTIPPPTCKHGPRRHRSGISGPNSKNPGQPYSMWVCQMPQGPDQCKPSN